MEIAGVLVWEIEGKFMFAEKHESACKKRGGCKASAGCVGLDFDVKTYLQGFEKTFPMCLRYPSPTRSDLESCQRQNCGHSYALFRSGGCPVVFSWVGAGCQEIAGRRFKVVRPGRIANGG